MGEPTMIERVARALVPVLCGDREDVHGNSLPAKTFDELPAGWQARHLDYARAAIKAMLEPTMAMKLAAAPRITAQMIGPSPPADYDAANDGWKAMINTALGGEDG